MTTERDRSLASQRAIESEIHKQEMRENNLLHQVKERDAIETKIVSNRTRFAELNARAKVVSSVFLPFVCVYV